MWIDYLRNVNGAEVWSAAWYALHQVGATIQALTDSQRKLSNKALENQGMQRHHSSLQNEDHQCHK